MKLGITSRVEIRELMDFLIELKNLHSADYSVTEILASYQDEDEAIIDIDDFNANYPFMSQIFNGAIDMEDVVDGISLLADTIPFQRILWNCDALLVNCADLSEDVDILDFPPRIHTAFNAVELLRRMHDFMAADPKNALGQGAQMYAEMKQLLAAYDAVTPKDEEK